MTKSDYKPPRYIANKIKQDIGPVWWSGNWSDEEQDIINDIYNKCGDVKKTQEELSDMKIRCWEEEKEKYGDLSRILKVRSLYTIAECLYFKNDREKAIKQVVKIKNEVFKEHTRLRQNGWKKIKQEVLNNDNNACVVCGHTDNLEVHHIIPFEKVKVHEFENLITLCTKCHDYISNDKLWIMADFLKYNPKQVWNEVVFVYLNILQSRGFFVSVTRKVSSSWTGNVSCNWIISKTPIKKPIKKTVKKARKYYQSRRNAKNHKSKKDKVCFESGKGYYIK